MNDKDIIQQLGGSTKLAAILSTPESPVTVQRVNNWKERGIPAQVKLDHPHLFLMRSHQKQSTQLAG